MHFKVNFIKIFHIIEKRKGWAVPIWVLLLMQIFGGGDSEYILLNGIQKNVVHSFFRFCTHFSRVNIHNIFIFKIKID